MIHKMFLIYDQKAELYNAPICKRNRGEFLREIQSTVNKEGNTLNQFPGDFHIFEVGDYDDCTGKVIMYEIPQNLGCLLEFVDKQVDLRNARRGEEPFGSTMPSNIHKV